MHTVNQMLQVRRGGECLVIYNFVASFKVKKREVNMGDAWFQVLPLSLSELEFWSAGVICLLLIWLRSPEICLL